MSQNMCDEYHPVGQREPPPPPSAAPHHPSPCTPQHHVQRRKAAKRSCSSCRCIIICSHVRKDMWQQWYPPYNYIYGGGCHTVLVRVQENHGRDQQGPSWRINGHISTIDSQTLTRVSKVAEHSSSHEDYGSASA